MQLPSTFSLAESQIPYTSQYFRIMVGSATYDRSNSSCFGFQSHHWVVFRIEKDIRVTTEAALGLIGGTMGLFTGQSITNHIGLAIIWNLDIYSCRLYIFLATLVALHFTPVSE